MRIVDRATFLAMPAGTVFTKYEPCIFGEMAIKEGTTPSGNDFMVQNLMPWPEDCDNTTDWVEAMEAAQAGTMTAPLSFDIPGRDGLFAEGQLFAVFERVEVERLIGRFQEALAAGYAAEAV